MSGIDSDFVIENNVLKSYTGSIDAPNIIIPYGVTMIGDRVFQGFVGSITIPNSVTTIGQHALFFSSDLAMIPNSVTTIGVSACYGCVNLTKIPRSLTTIANFAFSDCIGLVNIELNREVSLESESFQNCHNLNYIFIADDQVERIKDILPPGQRRLVFGRSSEQYQLYCLEKNHDKKISQVIGAAYHPMLYASVHQDMTSGVCAFLSYRDIEAVATTNKCNSSLLRRLNEIEKPLRPLAYSTVEGYSAAMSAYKIALQKAVSIGATEAGAGACAGAGAGSNF